MGVKAQIAPSMLSSDFANLASEAQRMLDCGADWLHMDIMAFRPKSYNRAYLDCHLMVTDPLVYVEPLGKAGASGFTFHVEVSKDSWEELVEKIKSQGMRPGVALKPGTPIEEVYPLLEGRNPVELVLVMTVEPGFGGQKFMPEMMDKVRQLRKKYPSLDIEDFSDHFGFRWSEEFEPPEDLIFSYMWEALTREDSVQWVHAHCNLIHHPVIRIWQRFVADNIFARKDTNNMGMREASSCPPFVIPW
ncbi:hypothetical protein KSS87_014668 [Heliosperma pusillum]|nr:hypothetical protein KSS87_014668 [Heliosperma pusillum]